MYCNMKTLNKILKKNLRRKGHNIVAISHSLLDVLLEETKYEEELVKMSSSRNQDGFILLTEIPDEVKEFLSLNCVVMEPGGEDAQEEANPWLTNGFDFLVTTVVDDRIKKIGERKVLDELKMAYKYFDRYKCEFIDSFHDDQLVSNRARRLSVLMVLRKIMNEKTMLKEAFLQLQKLDPEFELLAGGIRRFYEQLDWYSRIGEVRGCIIA